MQRDEKIIVALTGCSHALSHGYLLIFPTVLLLLQKEFSIGYLELGVIGNIMTFTYGLGALPGGMIYNHLGPKKLYLFCFLGSTITVILVAISSGLFLFTAGLALLGVLGSIYHPLANSLITSKVRGYGQALGIHGAAGNIGLASTPFIIGLIASYLGWRQAYLWSALPGFMLSVWAFFVDMSPKEETKTVKPTPTQKSTPRGLRTYFSLPLVLLYLTNMFQGFSFSGSLIFLPAYMAKRTSFHLFSLDSVALGGMLSAIVLAVGVLGQYGGGILAQQSRLERKMLLMPSLSLPFILAMSFATDLLLLIFALLFFFFNFFLQPMNNTLLAQYTAVETRGTAFGIYFFLSFAVGSLASSFCGFIAQNFGLRWVFMGLSSGVFLLIFTAFFLQRIERPPDRTSRVFLP
jgi:FSR family fosmidomycin resistance protein-like MFS transporter